jgi:hypothetical protein
MNSQAGDFRYFCSETYRDENFDYSVPSYEDSNYSSDDDDSNTCVDANSDGMCDDYEDESNTCSDSNDDGYCD